MSAWFYIEKLPYLTRFDVAAELRFFEDRIPVAENLESPFAGRNQVDLDAGIMIPELSRQTGGSGLIVSKSTVLDADFHCSSGAGCTQGNVRPTGAESLRVAGAMDC